MLYQLFWQNPAPDRTGEVAFVGQYGPVTDAVTHAKFLTWAGDEVERRKAECPAGWVPVVWDETDPRFVKAAE